MSLFRALNGARTQLSRAPWTATVAGAATAGAILYYSTTSPVRLESPAALTGDGNWVDFKLSKVEEVSHNVKRFVFALPEKDQVLGLVPTGAVLTKFLQENGKNVIRPYTPVNDLRDKGFVEFIVKVYPDGKMGNHLASLKPNDTVAFKGPIQKYKWTPNLHDQIALIGAGSGITPLYQLLRAIDQDPTDHTKAVLLYGNVTEDDILIKKEIDDIVARNPGQFKAHFFLDKPPTGWTGDTGFVNAAALRKYLFKPTDGNVKVFVCGPPPLYAAISGPRPAKPEENEHGGALKEVGFSVEQVFKF